MVRISPHYLPFPSVQSLPQSIDKAMTYLKKHLPNLINPYAAAMTLYALANENELNQEEFNMYFFEGFFTQYSLS